MTTYEVIVIVYKSRHVLEPFLEHIGTTVPVRLVDNSYAEDDLSDLLSGYPNVTRVDSGGNLGYSAAANVGAEASGAEVLIFMNPDTRPEPPAIEAMVHHLEAHRDVASVGAAGIDSAGGGSQPNVRRALIHSVGLHRKYPLAGIFQYPSADQTIDVDWVSGSGVAIRREVFTAVGGFDPEYFIYMSDFDLGRRVAAAGHRQQVLGGVVVPHDDGESSDLPSTWSWERRGRAWTRYLRNTRRVIPALAISVILGGGFVARALAYTVLGRRNRAKEVWTYLTSMTAQWVKPVSSVPE